MKWTHPNNSKLQPTPQLATDTIGGGRRKIWGSGKDHFARLHGLESDLYNDTYVMQDTETLIDGRPSPTPVGKSTVTVTAGAH